MSGKAQQQSRIKELITLGREQKYLTYAEVNDHLPEDISDPEQVEDIIRDPRAEAAANVAAQHVLGHIMLYEDVCTVYCPGPFFSK